MPDRIEHRNELKYEANLTNYVRSYCLILQFGPYKSNKIKEEASSYLTSCGCVCHSEFINIYRPNNWTCMRASMCLCIFLLSTTTIKQTNSIHAYIIDDQYRSLFLSKTYMVKVKVRCLYIPFDHCFVLHAVEMGLDHCFVLIS